MLTASFAAAGSFSVEMPLDTYIDAKNPSASLSEEKTLWATSEEGEPVREIYLNFNNAFGRVGVFNPDQIESATLTLDATDVEVPGEIGIYFAEGSITDIDWNNRLEYETNESASVDVDQDGEYSIDVTQLLKRAREACPEDCGYSLVLVAEDGTSVGFASSESPEGRPNLKYTTAE
jgi:hypothetical protein